MEAAKTERAVTPDLSAIRSGLLLFLQDPTSAGDLLPAIHSFKALADAAQLPEMAVAASNCVGVLEGISIDNRTELEMSIRFVLDQLADIEAFTLDPLTADDDFISKVSELVDESFKHLTDSSDGPQPVIAEYDSSFEVDDEILDIFRSEASELLSVISANLTIFTSTPDNQEALWEMRRAVHTLKGAAGIVGLDDASKLAHRIEDVLGRLVENSVPASPRLTELLRSSVTCLDNASAGKEHQAEVSDLLGGFDHITSDAQVKGDNAAPAAMRLKVPANEHTPAGKKDTTQPNSPIVRVSLDRLNELQAIVRDLALTRNRLAESLDKCAASTVTVPPNSEMFAGIESSLSDQLRLSRELQEKLEQIRMVRFGNLTTRFNRTVHVTCQEEDKKAEVIIENEDIELDTQIMDALVEPMLHLLRNAVVHGIETPEQRRMIGKPEKATIVIRVDRTDSELMVSVADNGRGIAIGNLKEKALTAGSISPQQAESMTDEDAVELIFLRGVTTAAKLNLNAGRGIGMAIVKENIENRGGSISVLSEAQKGTTFVVKLPLSSTPAKINDQQITEETPTAPAIEEKLTESTVEQKPAEPITENKRVEPSIDDWHSDPVVSNDMPADTVVPEKTDFEPSCATSSQLTVLIVDDSLLMRQTMCRVVEKAGWTAMSATDGREGLKLLRAGERPNIVITDLEMPNLDGFGLIQALKRDPQLSMIPVVMVTSRTERIHRDKAISLGAAKFLTKPVEGAELKSIIHKLCLAEAAETI